MPTLIDRQKEIIVGANKVLIAYAKGKIKHDELAPPICKKLKITTQELHRYMEQLKATGKVSWNVPNIVPKRRVVSIINTKPLLLEDYKTNKTPSAKKSNGKVNGKGNGKRKYTKRKTTTPTPDINNLVQGEEITMIATPRAMAALFKEMGVLHGR